VFIWSQIFQLTDLFIGCLLLLMSFQLICCRLFLINLHIICSIMPSQCCSVTVLFNCDTLHGPNGGSSYSGHSKNLPIDLLLSLLLLLQTVA